MDNATLAARVNRGFGIAARIVGPSFAQYRPLGVSTAIVPANYIGTIPAWITADVTLMASKPFAYGKPVGYAAIDTTLTDPGDYLVGAIVPGGDPQTFFISSQDIPAVVQVVNCNQTVSIRRPLPAALPGMNPPYGGDTGPTQPDVLTDWPASVLVTLRAVRGPIELPGDTGQGRWIVLLPPTPVELRTSDIVVLGDADTSRGVVNAAELTSLGWRLAVEEQAT